MNRTQDVPRDANCNPRSFWASKLFDAEASAGADFLVLFCPWDLD